jgi:hypothetical protein
MSEQKLGPSLCKKHDTQRGLDVKAWTEIDTNAIFDIRDPYTLLDMFAEIARLACLIGIRIWMSIRLYDLDTCGR